MSKMTALKERSVLSLMGSLPRRLLPGAELREEDDLADRALAGQQHHQPVDAHAQASRRGHAVLEGEEEVLVHDLGLLVARGALGRLLQEALPLLDGVVQLRVGVTELEAAGEGLEAP